MLTNIVNLVFDESSCFPLNTVQGYRIFTLVTSHTPIYFSQMYDYVPIYTFGLLNFAHPHE